MDTITLLVQAAGRVRYVTAWYTDLLDMILINAAEDSEGNALLLTQKEEAVIVSAINNKHLSVAV